MKTQSTPGNSGPKVFFNPKTGLFAVLDPHFKLVGLQSAPKTPESGRRIGPKAKKPVNPFASTDAVAAASERAPMRGQEYSRERSRSLAAQQRAAEQQALELAEFTRPPVMVNVTESHIVSQLLPLPMRRQPAQIREAYQTLMFNRPPLELALVAQRIYRTRQVRAA